MVRFIILLLSIPLILVVAAFAFRNAESVPIDFFIAAYQLPLALILLVALIFGGIIGYLINYFVLINQKYKIRQLTKKNKEMLSLSSVFEAERK